MKNSCQHIQTGKAGEGEGVAYLKKEGYQILNKNYRTYAGEIDCIAMHNGALVFIEIKTRRNNSFGFPAESVVKAKQRKIIQSAQIYLQEKSYNQSKMPTIRFDVLGILMPAKGQVEFELIQDAFQIE